VGPIIGSPSLAFLPRALSGSPRGVLFNPMVLRVLGSISNPVQTCSVLGGRQKIGCLVDLVIPQLELIFFQ
jgi:hypothetical protein